MALIGVTGLQGSGKTLFATRYVLKNFCMRGLYHEAFSNVKILPFNGREVTMLDREMFKHLADVTNAVVVIDEAYLWMDSRTSVSKENRSISYLILQSRKRKFDVIWCAQLVSSVDKRLRESSETWIKCMKGKTGFRYAVMKRRPWLGGWYLARWLNLPYERAKDIFPYFDTNQIVSII
jgi:hypothetical protein